MHCIIYSFKVQDGKEHLFLQSWSMVTAALMPAEEICIRSVISSSKNHKALFFALDLSNCRRSSMTCSRSLLLEVSDVDWGL